MARITWIHIDEILNEWRSEDFYPSCAITGKTEMESVLNYKRKDAGYEELKQSLLLYGLKKPLSYVLKANGKKSHLNGHHRLAALIDLGFTMIPYIKDKNYQTVSDQQWTGLVRKNPNLVHEVPKSKSLLAL